MRHNQLEQLLKSQYNEMIVTSSSAVLQMLHVESPQRREYSIRICQERGAPPPLLTKSSQELAPIISPVRTTRNAPTQHLFHCLSCFPDRGSTLEGVKRARKTNECIPRWAIGCALGFENSRSGT